MPSSNDIASPDEGALLLLKQRQASLLAKKVAALKQDGLAFYVPHRKQSSFHAGRQADGRPAKRRLFVAGNRAGKSTGGVAEDCAWVRGERVWLPKDDPWRTLGIPKHPVKGLVIATNWDKVHEVFSSKEGTKGKLWKFLPSTGFVKKSTKNHEGVISEFTFANGSSLKFATVKSWLNDPASIESTDYDFIHVDEPCPEGMFKGASRGLVDRGGFAWFTLTALSQPWIIDAFQPGGIFDNICHVTAAAMADNPYLTQENRDDFERTLTEDEKACRIHGQPLHLAGLVYKEYKEDIHLLSTLPDGWKSWSEPPPDWSYYYYIDPHPRTPNMVLFIVVDPFENLYCFHDMFSPKKRHEICAEMHKVLDGHHVIRGRIDPIAFIEDKETGRTWADDFSDCGFPVTKAVKDLLHGIARTQERFDQRTQNGKPTIFFTPSCRRLRWEIKRYSWDQETNHPIDEDDHAVECLYRAILDNPRYVDPEDYTRNTPDLETFERPRFDLADVSFVD